MRSSGNGNPEICAANLLRIVRGEVAFDRTRGRDAALVDKPVTNIDAVADAEWVLETYEPRVEAELNLEEVDGLTGDFALLANIKRKEEEG